MSVLHSGSETGRNESTKSFEGTWKSSCETRSYELEDGTRVYVSVFMADFIGGFRDAYEVDDPLGGACQYAVQIHPAPEYERPVKVQYGGLDVDRLTPAMAGETRTLLAWEAALDVADALLR